MNSSDKHDNSPMARRNKIQQNGGFFVELPAVIA
jgi:hypothetical protein